MQTDWKKERDEYIQRRYGKWAYRYALKNWHKASYLKTRSDTDTIARRAFFKNISGKYIYVAPQKAYYFANEEDVLFFNITWGSTKTQSVPRS